ncbi:MAG: hypothetical protein ACOX6S_01780 [Clostridia bacterium]|jgi:hypothetical protein
MQCGCPECGTLMAQVVKGFDSYCQCPACLHKCRDCLGRDEGFSTFIPKAVRDKGKLLERFRKSHNIIKK